MNTRSLDQHIEVTPEIAGGKARIAGHRITVQNIVIWHESFGKSADEIASEYGLTLADVYAALAYYYDHKAEVDAALEENRRYYKSQKKSAPSLLMEKLKTGSHA